MGDSRTITVGLVIKADGSIAVQELDKVTDSSAKLNSGIGGLSPAAALSARALGILGTALAGLKLADVAADATMLAARVQTLGAVMPIIGNNVGYTGAQMDSFAASVKRMGITTEESRSVVSRMASSHMNLAEAADLARIAQDAAVIADINSSEALGRMTDGIVSNQVEILRNLGLTVNFEQAHRKLAQTLHKSVDELTEAERIQARTNAVMEKGKDIAGGYETAMGTSGKQINSLKRYHDELKLVIGDIFNPSLSVGVETYTSVLKALLQWGQDNKPALRELAADLAGIATAIRHPLDAMTNLVLDPFMKDEDATQQQAAIDRAYQQTVAAIAKRQEAARIDAANTARQAREREDTELQRQEKDRKTREKRERDGRELSMVFTQMRERDLLIGKQADEKELIQLDLKHRQEIDKLKNLHATAAQLDEAAGLQLKERRDVTARQQLDRQKQSALAAARIAEADYQAQVQWLDKLDQYQLKSGRISATDALDNKFSRERQFLELKLQTLAVEIDQEQSAARRNELEAEYWRLTDQVRQSKEQQGQETGELLAKEQQLAFAHGQQLVGIAAASHTARLQFIGQEQQALDLHYASKQQQLDAEYVFEMERLNLSQQEKLARQREYQEQSYQLQQEQAQRQAQLWWDNSQTYIGFAQQMTTMGLQMLLFDEKQRTQIGKRMLATGVRFLAQELQQYMFHKAKEHILAAAAAASKVTSETTAAVANLGILETQATAWAAYYAAHSLNPVGAATYGASAVAMAAVAGGVVPAAMATATTIGASDFLAEAALATAWGTGGILVGALGEAGASAIEGGTAGSTTPAGYGAGSPASPVGILAVPSTITNANSRSLVVNVHVYGEAQQHDWDRIVRNEIAPALKKANSDGVKW